MSNENSSMIDAEAFMASLCNTNGDSSSHLVDLDDDEDSSSNEVEVIKELKINLDKHNCDLCCKGTFLLNRLLEFGGILNDKNKFACDICCVGFRTKYGVTKHKKMHKNLISNENINGDGQIETTNLHNESTTSRMTCEICLQSLKNKKTLADHQRNKHGNLKFACTECNIKCFNLKQYKYHLTTHARSPKKLFSCPACIKAKKGNLRERGATRHTCIVKT
ncbi:hypothetical protein TNIN_195531 [Trichonephila inaurata madagascariensis]|uniref:C2H2-type domain-containing protein n=1 Tax=Trichonephila inaurata madagascariensis TaxID=2747483 RepID=A0A8X6IMX3_9ARAC|nr:hypothetical protein TNIN_195531 [Trichonephila inaurata madagascariensis]